MKKLFYTLGAALVMLASVSCEKKETVKEAQSSVEKADMTFKAVPAGTARTTVLPDGTTVVWSDGDAIRVFANGAEEGDVCEMISEAGNTYAEFGGQCAKQGPWTAICPAFDGATYSAGAITFTMPDEQDYAENTFAQGAMPCVAYSETTEFTFNHSFGVLKLSLKLASGKTGSVKSIKVTTKGSEKLNGTFAVSPRTSAKATKSGADGTNDITLNCGSGVELGTTAKDFWIVVPAGAFVSGFDVEITATDDKVATLSTESNNTINVGEIKPMPEKEIEFKAASPTTGEAERTGGVMVKWVQLWENGPKWAVYNVGATTTMGKDSYGGYYAWGGSESDEDIQGSDKDTAKKLWGTNWQMPTRKDFENLNSNCDVVWITNKDESEYGVTGTLFTGRGGYSGNSVFFPAAGYNYVSWLSWGWGPMGEGTNVYLWSSTYCNNGRAFCLVCYSPTNYHEVTEKDACSDDPYVCSVRAILAE